MRNFKTIGIVIGIYAIAMIVEVVMAFSSPSYEGGLSFFAILTCLGVLAPKVGYRWFDCFFAVIPFYGIFFIFRLAHRAAYLPNVDWEQRVN
jgi:hypothetical protein